MAEFQDLSLFLHDAVVVLLHHIFLFCGSSLFGKPVAYRDHSYEFWFVAISRHPLTVHFKYTVTLHNPVVTCYTVTMAKRTPTLLIDRQMEEVVLEKTREAIELKKAEAVAKRRPIIEWAESEFWVASTGNLIVFAPHQRSILKAAFTRTEDGGFPFRLIVLSSIKKSGKTCLAAVIARWIAEEQTRFGEIAITGNDQRQAKERSYEQMMESIRLTPGFKRKGVEGVLPDRWVLQASKMTCLTSGTRVEALSVDARGEAGANPDLTVWTELWGYEDPAAVKFFHEMTPPPTKPDSIRLIETYAGFDGESFLLREHYDLGKAGRQLTAGELAEMSGEPWDVWAEISSPDDLVPIWVNDSAGMFMYWDSGLVARRMPWQQGKTGERYYIEEEQVLPPPQFHRLHLNEWVGGEGEFLPMSAWDRCYDPDLPELLPGDKTPAVLGVDAATTKDCFGVVLVTRHPDRPQDPAIRHCKKWDPSERGGRIDYDEPEAFIRVLLHGGCVRGHPQYEPFFKADPKNCSHSSRAYACKECCDACRDGNLVEPYNIIEVAYDAYQLESIMGRLYKEGVNAQPFSQQQERMIADSQLYDVIIQKRLSHTGSEMLRSHIMNCAAHQSKDEDTKLRIIKKAPDRKIDLAVATSMAIRRCLYLLI